MLAFTHTREARANLQSSNLAATLARKGFTAVLLDLDVYAPSLQDYFHGNLKNR